MSNPNPPSPSPSALVDALAVQRLEHLRLVRGMEAAGVRPDEHAELKLALVKLATLHEMAGALLQQGPRDVPEWPDFAAPLVQTWLVVKEEVLGALPPAKRLQVLGAAAHAEVTEADVSVHGGASPAGDGAGMLGGLDLGGVLEGMVEALAGDLGPLVLAERDERVVKQEAKALPLSRSAVAWLERLPVGWLRSIATAHGVFPRQKKAALARAVADCLLSPELLRAVLAENLDEDDLVCLGELVVLGDVEGGEYDAQFAQAAAVPWDWPLVDPAVLPPGRLRALGLAFVGCRNGRARFAMPVELHEPVAKALLPLLEEADVPPEPELLEGLGLVAQGRKHELGHAIDAPWGEPAILPSPGPESMLELEVTLGVEQRVRRRLLVSNRRSLGSLHEILQVAFGWGDDHLHEFRSPDRRESYGSLDGPSDCQSEWETTVGEVLPSAGSRLAYTYDFGDDWQHDIRCVAHHAPGSTPSEPHCIAGEGAGPPEDVGGAYGYSEYLRALADPEHPEHEMMSEWRGPDFDPALFDRKAVNARLAPLAP